MFMTLPMGQGGSEDSENDLLMNTDGGKIKKVHTSANDLLAKLKTEEDNNNYYEAKNKSGKPKMSHSVLLD